MYTRAVVTIRDAVVEDVPTILAMLRESAEDQGFPGSLIVTEEDLAADGFSVNPRFFVLIAELEGSAAGMALFFFSYSTWGSRNGLYLEDLYVGRAFRGRRVGRALMIRLAQIAVDRDCGRFHWVVYAKNADAVRLYESVGADMLDDWRLMSLQGEGIARLAEQR